MVLVVEELNLAFTALMFGVAASYAQFGGHRVLTIYCQIISPREPCHHAMLAHSRALSPNNPYKKAGIML